MKLQHEHESALLYTLKHQKLKWHLEELFKYCRKNKENGKYEWDSNQFGNYPYRALINEILRISCIMPMLLPRSMSKIFIEYDVNTQSKKAENIVVDDNFDSMKDRKWSI